MPTPLTAEAVDELRRRFPKLRDDYFEYMSCIGWGETEAGPMIYGGPTDPDEIYGARDQLFGIILLGDDFQGFCFGFNVETGCYGEISAEGVWQPWPAEKGFLRYVSQPDENAT